MDAGSQYSENDIRKELRDFITESFLTSSGLDSFKLTDSFMDKGIIDSTGILELIEFIEDTFDIKVEDEEIVPNNLDSLNQLTSFIQRKIQNVSP